MNTSTMSVPFPFEPYPQQRQLMDQLFKCAEDSKVGLFESPTGTEKSLSAICSLLYWLELEERKIFESAAQVDEASSLDWFSAISQASGSVEEKEGNKKLAHSLKEIDLKVKQSSQRYLTGRSVVTMHRKQTEGVFSFNNSKRGVLGQRQSINLSSVEHKEEDMAHNVTDEYELQEYMSDRGEEDGQASSSDSDNEEDILELLPQIIYCSRTHSQISQFVSEIHKTKYSKSLRCVTLGSRKQMCINSKINNGTNSDSKISEKCLDMQKSKAKSTKRTEIGKASKVTKATPPTSSCEFHSRSNEHSLAYVSLDSVRDIEDFVSLGKELKACPFYSSRKAVAEAQLICMPYNLLVHEDARTSVGIKTLKNKVVIFDESHNLIEATNSAYSAELSFVQLNNLESFIPEYISRYRTVLGAKNLYYLNLLVVIVKGLKRVVMLKTNPTQPTNTVVPSTVSSAPTSSILRTNDLVFTAGLDNINLLKVKRHMAVSNLSKKIGGFIDSKYASAQVVQESGACVGKEVAPGLCCTALRSLQAALVFLTNNDEDGRIHLSTAPVQALQFVSLNPAAHFESIVSQARSVILLGGTLQPFSTMATSLFPNLASDKLVLFSCDHIAPARNVAAFAVKTSSDGVMFDFRHKTKQSKPLLHGLLSTLLSLANIVPHGVVVFFTSYAYLDSVLQEWASDPMLARLKSAKKLFVEPRAAREAEVVWTLYCSAATGDGAMLFCVIGGKLSEGINFSDELARCVAIVGMPYPDGRDALLQEKMKYADTLQTGAGRQFYEAICMKAVNQSIGRSIRHVRDYASIILLDERYASDKVISQLPGWISRSTTVAHSFDAVESHLVQFYKNIASSNFK